MNRPGTVTPASPLNHLAGAADAGRARLRPTTTLQTGTAASPTQITVHVASGRNGTDPPAAPGSLRQRAASPERRRPHVPSA